MESDFRYFNHNYVQYTKNKIFDQKSTPAMTFRKEADE